VTLVAILAVVEVVVTLVGKIILLWLMMGMIITLVCMCDDLKELSRFLFAALMFLLAIVFWPIVLVIEIYDLLYR
jgi:hypothetical protein